MQDWKCILVPVILTLFAFGSSFGQQSFRRHFIIAYDVSTPFIEAEKNCISYKQALKNLFSGKSITNFNEAYQNNLVFERTNGTPFFDRRKDEITFFHFNVAASEFDFLRMSDGGNNEKGIVSAFEKKFLKNKKADWTSFSQTQGTVDSYIDKLFSIKPFPPDFQGGVSMSNFVYPLALDKIDTTKYAEEYVLILLSDFRTGSTLGNTRDLDRVRDIYRVPYGVALQPKSAVAYIKGKIDFLASKYYKVDFFQYSFIPDNTINPIGILGYKIKPRIGVLTPEDVSLFVDGDLDLNQKGYRSTSFNTNATTIRFTHNKSLVPTALKMSIVIPSDTGDKVLFDDVVATTGRTQLWESKYTRDKELMNFDPAKYTYFLPGLNITIDSIINKRDFKNLLIKYQFSAQFKNTDYSPLNFIYNTERSLPIQNIDFSTKATILLMTIVLPILCLLCLLIFLITLGKPKKLFFYLEGYLDSFEKIDFRAHGKALTPYKAWNSELQDGVDYLIVNGAMEFKSPGYAFNWNSPVFLRLSVEHIPDGFEMFLKKDLQDLKEFGVGIPTSIKKTKNNKLYFVVGIRQVDITKSIGNPELVKFSVEAVVKDSVVGIGSKLGKTVDYQFHLGADLQDVWVGFDPGTSGSCIAVGSSTDNIILGEDIAKNKIIPSLLVFDKKADFHGDGNDIPESIYKHGTAAEFFYPNKKQYQAFQSIKKLLGFGNMKEIQFDNKNTLSLKGKDLVGLLVKGLFKDINDYFRRPELNGKDYLRDGVFNPLRTVIAIPNNFTISKIQDIIDCLTGLNQFKEIRYVYEAEAVLFYYLSNYSKYSKGEVLARPETILVFDMGGATINATMVRAGKTIVHGRPKYKIDMLGKIGYGIGGDSIDYCIIKFLQDFPDEFPELAAINIFDRKDSLSKLAFEIKREIISNYDKKNPYLITAPRLENFINIALGLSITIDPETSGFYSYFLKNAGEFPLFKHPVFAKIIYNNVKDAVDEVVALSEDMHIDKVIFSGRSSAFPLIKETVEKQVKAKSSGTACTLIPLGLEESKMAVAIGACWYGINKNSVRLNNLKTNAAFGFKKTKTPDQNDVEFHELIEPGCNFDINKGSVGALERIVDFNDDFAFDGSKVNFYQVMGKNAEKVLAQGKKHKFSKIATVNIDQRTTAVGITVHETDVIECFAELRSNRTVKARGIVVDQLVEEANEDHYTWAVK